MAHLLTRIDIALCYITFVKIISTIAETIHCSTVYWNAHRHPFVWANAVGIGRFAHPGTALLPRAA